jgi:predicted RNA-binding protein with PUA-like domain
MEALSMAKQYWLMKSEPDVYSIDDLARDGSTCWEGVRNYKARNNMKTMAVGDEVLYYHSNANPPGVVGIARVCREAYPDHFQFDTRSKYFDAKSREDDPRWHMVDIEFVAKADEPVGLPEIKADDTLAEMELVRYGRLSVQSVRKTEFYHVKRMAGL